MIRAWLLALALVPFLPSLWHPFFADDYIHLERVRSFESPADALDAWMLVPEDSAAWWVDPEAEVSYFRPLVSLAFFLDWLVWGLNPSGFHFTNLALHGATTLVVYFIARRLLGSEARAAIAGALFALHPCHAEAVLWISARTDLLAGFLVTLAFSLYLRSRESHQGSRRFLVASLGLFGLALLAKEMAATFPCLLLAYELAFRRHEPASRRLLAPALATAIVMLYLALRGGVSSPPHPFFHGPSDPDALSSLLHGAVMYLADLVLFVPADPVVTLPFWKAHPWAFAGLAALTALLLAWSVRSVARSEHRWFPLAWIALSLLPVLAISPGERFLYLPSVGICLLVGAKGDRGRWIAPVALLVGTITLAKTLAFGELVTASRRVVDDAAAELASAPGARLLLAIDLPAASALGFAHALRLESPGSKLEVEILSIAPGFLSFDRRPAPGPSWTSDETFRLEIPAKSWNSYIASAFWAERPPFSAGDRVAREGVEIEILEVDQGRPKRIEVRIGEVFRDQAVVFKPPPDEARPAS